MPSGIPSSCVVVYDELVSDPREVERRIHERFKAYRVEDRRGFFRIPVKAAVVALQYGARDFPVAPDEGERAEILSQLHIRYRYWIKYGIVSVAIVQLAGAVLLEVVSAYPPGRGRTVERVDMDVMGDHFDPDDPIEVNGAKFLEFDEIDIINVAPLFEEEVARKIDEAHRQDLESIEQATLHPKRRCRKTSSALPVRSFNCRARCLSSRRESRPSRGLTASSRSRISESRLHRVELSVGEPPARSGATASTCAFTASQSPVSSACSARSSIHTIHTIHTIHRSGSASAPDGRRSSFTSPNSPQSGPRNPVGAASAWAWVRSRQGRESLLAVVL
ncbi:hypothetical protein SAMN06273567_106151 [Geodermatophilus aquaeductus]|uniref:Uncharacterized protein n=1 Tax=Geodermatophilus aquaeductus TaxID=1564161 RepID=A0A521EZ15_9ACTN|nr:hypothetical protein SAMN06273567_106151 [Geodermatophilus aquaeductus]